MAGQAIDRAMRLRHKGDLIVPECKDGPTHGAFHRRLDYWVLRRSWAHPAMIGYEVKVSRADFIGDQKWTDYLPLCNELWFVAPPGIIQPEELSDGVGLLRLAGSRLITVRKAAWREIQPPVDLMTYILMCRTRIDREGAGDEDYWVNHWKDWLAQKEEKREIGREVSQRLRAKYYRDVEAARRENKRLADEIETATRLRTALERRGIDWSLWLTDKSLDEQLRVKPWDRSRVEQAHEALGNLLGKD